MCCVQTIVVFHECECEVAEENVEGETLCIVCGMEVSKPCYLCDLVQIESKHVDPIACHVRFLYFVNFKSFKVLKKNHALKSNWSITICIDGMEFKHPGFGNQFFS